MIYAIYILLLSDTCDASSEIADFSHPSLPTSLASGVKHFETKILEPIQTSREESPPRQKDSRLQNIRVKGKKKIVTRLFEEKTCM